MNINTQLICDACSTKIDCRIGMSNRDVQPFQFACPACEERINYVIKNNNQELSGATISSDFEGPFDGSNPFIDLHLDFPVAFGEYQMGDTAFFRAIGEIGEKRFKHLAGRLNILNTLHKKQRVLERLITQYKNNNVRLFEKAIKSMDIPSIELKSHSKEDIVAALYSATSTMSLPFTIHEHNKELSSDMPQILMDLHESNYEQTTDFINELIESSFISNLHHDCLSLYPKMLSLDLPLRPALYFDYTDINSENRVPSRVSSADFDKCNNFYKDMAEVFSRQLVLLAGLNNLIKRNDYNLFDDSVRINRNGRLIREFSSLDSYSDVDLGRKISAIDDSFYKIDPEAIDNKLRNVIAHYKYDYEESTQKIRYYPRKEGMKREAYDELNFLEFMRKTLLLFREIHNLNHVIKAIIFYRIFVLKKDF